MDSGVISFISCLHCVRLLFPARTACSRKIKEKGTKRFIVCFVENHRKLTKAWTLFPLHCMKLFLVGSLFLATAWAFPCRKRQRNEKKGLPLRGNGNEENLLIGLRASEKGGGRC